MKYTMSRKLNLGRLAGIQYESVDLTVEGCETREEAMKEIESWKNDIIKQIQKAKEQKQEEDMLQEFNKLEIKARKSRKK
jgi:hypothetical protein